MKQYLDLMRRVRDNGTFKADRTGTGTYSVFGHQMRFDLADGFPLVTTNKCHLKSIIHELLWFLPPCHYLFQFYVGEATPAQRMAWVRRSGRSSYVAELQGLSGCGVIDQHSILDGLGAPRESLSCQLYQRSADIFLGVPFNIASYALLTMMIAQVVGMAPGEFVWIGGDCHLYSNHLEQADLQLSRNPHIKAPVAA